MRSTLWLSDNTDGSDDNNDVYAPVGSHHWLWSSVFFRFRCYEGNRKCPLLSCVF